MHIWWCTSFIRKTAIVKGLSVRVAPKPMNTGSICIHCLNSRSQKGHRSWTFEHYSIWGSFKTLHRPTYQWIQVFIVHTEGSTIRVALQPLQTTHFLIVIFLNLTHPRIKILKIFCNNYCPSIFMEAKWCSKNF